MTAPTAQFTDIAKRSQDVVTAAVRSWTDTVQSFAGDGPTLPDAQTVVDTYFDFAEKALAKQRELAQQAVAVGVKTAKAVADQAAKVTAQA